jgi:tRNA-uridine 2-sulfurtransferase
MKAICSFSGGLDSILAVRIIQEQGIEVEAVHFDNGFGGCGERDNEKNPVKYRADRLGIKLTGIDVGSELLRILKAPRFGFGRNMNPCMDCHLLFFKRCGEYMKEAGASFIVTGEVLGERPMSQRRWAIDQIDQNSGLEGLILRPLCARLMKPTIPEEKGWVDRHKLYAISGRSRQPQMELAAKFGIDFYPNAAGGCLLTEKEFSDKMRDLMEHKDDFDIDDVSFLKIGRHFRVSMDAKLILGRDEKENKLLLDKASGEICFITVDVPGPVGVLRGNTSKRDEELALRIISAYSNIPSGEQMKVSRMAEPGAKGETLNVRAVPKRDIRKYSI